MHETYFSVSFLGQLTAVQGIFHFHSIQWWTPNCFENTIITFHKSMGCRNDFSWIIIDAFLVCLWIKTHLKTPEVQTSRNHFDSRKLVTPGPALDFFKNGQECWFSNLFFLSNCYLHFNLKQWHDLMYSFSSSVAFTLFKSLVVYSEQRQCFKTIKRV